jgi:hypothetical protein
MQQNKLATKFAAIPTTAVNKTGSQLTTEKPSGAQYKWNSSFFHPFHRKEISEDTCHG